jgi:hypothetical protein
MNTVSLGLEALIDDSACPARDVPVGEPFSPWRLKVLTQREFVALSSSKDSLSAAQLAYFAWFDLLAPTSHNTVPQRFRFHPGTSTLAIWLDRAFVLSASDTSGRQAAVSLGCGIANALVAARAYGWDADVDVLPVPLEQTHPEVAGQSRYTEIARLRFRQGAEPLADDELLRLMLRRKVIRAEFDDRVKLPRELVHQLAQVVERGFPGLELHLLTDAATLLFLGKFQELADTTVFNRDAFALELGQWFLENDDTSCLGMRGAEFGLGDESTRHMNHGLRRLVPFLPDEMAGFAKAGNLGMRSSSAVAVITVKSDTLDLRIAAGRAYEEMALLLLQHRFCTAMHAGITEVKAPNLALRGRLRTSWQPMVVFRIGQPLRDDDWHRPHSARPDLGAIMLPEEIEDTP